MNRLGTVFVTVLTLQLTLLLAGCAPSPAGENRIVRYAGRSRYRPVVNGDTNMLEGYKSHPVLAEDEEEFYQEASAYLKRVGDDLIRIVDGSYRAWKKIKAAADTIPGGSELIVTIPVEGDYGVGGVRPDHLNASTYPAFPDFNHKPPQPPSSLVDRVAWDEYREALFDYEPTTRAYIEDGNNFIRNCWNDYEAIKEIMRPFEAHLESLESSHLVWERWRRILSWPKQIPL